MEEATKVLDYGYVRFIEAWGHGDAGQEVANARLDPVSRSLIGEDMECGIVEAARQSTQGSFRGWEDRPCTSSTCQNGLDSSVEDFNIPPHVKCQVCNGTGIERGDARLLSHLYSSKPQHATPFEFSGMTIEVQAPILVYREWHRHRTQSYNEMSARYSPLPNQNYIPEWSNLKERGEKAEASRNKQEKSTSPWNEESAQRWWQSLPTVYDYLEDKYQEALRSGVPKEMARILIPVGRYSRMRATGNLRNWLAFVTLRSDPQAQWEIRQYSLIVEQIIARKFPRTYDLFLKRRSVQ